MELERNIIINRWLPQLAQKLGRTVANLKAEGLRGGDFPSGGVRIAYEDDSQIRFRWAFFVTDPARRGKVAVFTEHCGYHEFQLGAEDSIEQVEHAVRLGAEWDEWTA